MRQMTEAEREILREQMRSLGQGTSRWRRIARDARLELSPTLFGLLLLVLLVAVVARWATGQDGLDSAAVKWTVLVGVPLCLAYAIVSSIHQYRNVENISDIVGSEIEAGKVLEEQFRFVEARRFQEPEHGGLIYCLRTSDDRVFVIYDYASQDLGVQGLDPFTSGFRPRRELAIVRTPISDMVISTEFAGEDFTFSETTELAAPSDQWPESEKFYDVDWADLDSALA